MDLADLGVNGGIILQNPSQDIVAASYNRVIVIIIRMTRIHGLEVRLGWDHM